MRRTAWYWLLLVVVIAAVGMAGRSVLTFQDPDAQLVVPLTGRPDVSVQPIPPETPIRWVTRKPTEIFLVRAGGTWHAFANRSTHQGEPVIWREADQRFVDVISGALWDKAGRPVGGPAPRGLDGYPVKVDGEAAIINLSRPRAGDYE